MVAPSGVLDRVAHRLFRGGHVGILRSVGAAMKYLVVMCVNAGLFWFVVSVPLGMLAGEWWYGLRDKWREREDEYWNACVHPGGEC
jgi:hypothetical protein